MIKKLLLAVAAFIAAISMAYAASVDVNSATKEQLDGVPGIGPALAERIIEERKKGSYKDVNDLVDRVRGIGPENVKKMQSGGLTVGGGRPSAMPRPTETKREAPAAATKPADMPKDSPRADPKPVDAKKEAPKADMKADKPDMKADKADMKAEKADKARAKADKEKDMEVDAKKDKKAKADDKKDKDDKKK